MGYAGTRARDRGYTTEENHEEEVPERDPREVLEAVLDQATAEPDWWQYRTMSDMRSWLRDAQQAESFLNHQLETIAEARARMRVAANDFVDTQVGRVDLAQKEVAAPTWHAGRND